MRLRPLLMLLLAAVIWPSGPAAASVFNPESFTLANGMQVIVVPNHRVPVVTHMVWYKVGAADEAPGKSGIAHFLEHLMFKGTANRESGEFSKLVARNGGRENAFTSQDYTGYFQTVAVDRLPLVMELEADRMRNLLFEAKEVEPERLVILEERRQRTDVNPRAILREHVNAALFLNHPYRIPVIGWAHEIKTLTIDDLKTFYRRWYAPNNAILVVAGDITAAQLRPLAERFYGTIPSQPMAERIRPQEPPQAASRRVVLRDARVRQPSWSRSYLAPSHRSPDGQHAYALEVLDEIMGGGATSRMYRGLVVEGKLAVSAGTHYDPDGLGPTRFVIAGSPRPGVPVERLETAMEEEVARLIADGVTETEVARAKQRMRASAVYARDSLGGGARMLGAALASGGDIASVEDWPDRIAAVTVEGVNAAARAVFSKPRSVTALLLPSAEEEARQ
jgi:zinc protease